MPLEEKENTIRARVRLPENFIQDSFRTIDIKKDDKLIGIKAVVGKLKDGDGSMIIQSYIFDKTEYNWTMQKVKIWLKENNITVKSYTIKNINFNRLNLIE